MISYDDAVNDSGPSSRAREAELLGRSAAMMREADRMRGADARGGRARIDAALFAQRLWSRLIEDLGSPANALAPALRADLISIGLFVLRSAEAAGRGEGTFAAAADVTDTLRLGLMAPMPAAA